MTYWAVLFITYLCSLPKKAFCTCVVVLILFIMAAFIAPDVSHDYQNYITGYYNASGGYFPEPMSRIIFHGAKITGLQASVSFFTLALLSISLKVVALRNLRLPISLFFLVYFSKLFLLLDLTQVRAGVAVALCLLAFEALVRNNIRRALIYVALAFCFHLSSIMFIVVFFINKKRPNIMFWLCALFVGFCISLIDIKLYLLALMNLVHAPANYLTYLNGNTDFVVNPFNVLTILNVTIFLIFCVYNRVLNDSLLNLAFKLYGVSIISFYVFIDFPVISFRVSEFFLVYQVILLAGLYSYITPSQKWLYTTLLFSYSILQLYLTYNKAAIIESYRISMF